MDKSCSGLKQTTICAGKPIDGVQYIFLLQEVELRYAAPNDPDQSLIFKDFSRIKAVAGVA